MAKARVWVLWGLVWLVSGATAEKRLLSLSEAELTGQYVFRGARCGPTGILRYSHTDYKLTSQWHVRYNSWSYIHLDEGIGFGESRHGLSVRYHVSPLWSVEAGGTYYDRPNQPAPLPPRGKSTGEGYATATFHVPFEPRITAAYDFRQRVGTYVELGGKERFTLGHNGWRGELLADVGYATRQARGLTAGHVRLALWYPLDKHLFVGPGFDLWVPSKRADPGANYFRGALSLGVAYGLKF